MTSAARNIVGPGSNLCRRNRSVALWADLNAAYAALWPNITRNGGHTPDDADEHKGRTGKFEKYFQPAPGAGH